jgi:restriction system protein
LQNVLGAERNVRVPSVTSLLWPTLNAVRAIGDSGTIEEIDERVVEVGRFSEEQQSVLHKDGPKTEIEYRLAWAKTYLKGMGLLDNSTRGVWATTERGRATGEGEIDGLLKDYRARLAEERRRREAEAGEDGENGSEGADDEDWRQELLQALLAMTPDGFERLAQRLLRAAGFINTSITARSGDGGLDGMGVYRLSLVSFPVFFQCKRYRGSVGPEKVRDFRGAMAGRGDKGLLITTGSFTNEARREATRDGAPPIDLIDGDRLCDLLKENALGVRTKVVETEEVAVVTEFFSET